MEAMNKSKALVVLSGGQDSTTCLFLAKQKHEEVHAITFDYRQSHSIEISSALKVGEMAGVASHKIVDVIEVLESTSPLLNNGNNLERYKDAEQMAEVIGNRIEHTFVPMRNVLFLTIAVNRAIALGCTHIYTGICQEDNANYPDCTENFRTLFQDMANIALGLNPFVVEGRYDERQIIIKAPLMYLSKAESVRLAYETPGCWQALAYSHTSYDGKYPPTDMNHANVLRADGFEKANLPDPLVLRAFEEHLMPLPTTKNYEQYLLGNFK